MRNLPRNISRHPDGYLVRVQRGGICYQAFVSRGAHAPSRAVIGAHAGDSSCGDTGPGVVREGANHDTRGACAPLEEAIRLRDRFLAIHGAITQAVPWSKTKRAYSNTGIRGVSETVHWSHQRPHDCFLVSWHAGGHHRTRRVYYGPHRSRSDALQQAIQLRAEKTTH